MDDSARRTCVIYEVYIEGWGLKAASVMKARLIVRKAGLAKRTSIIERKNKAEKKKREEGGGAISIKEGRLEYRSTIDKTPQLRTTQLTYSSR